MATVGFTGFLGENRALQPMLLPDGVGTRSTNQKPGRGDLRPWREPLTVASVPPGRKTIYRMGRDVASNTQYWLSWTGKVDAVRGFDPEDSTERTYYTGDGVPKVTDNLMALGSAPYPASWRPLGIPAPASAPLVIASGGTAAAKNEDYFYCYTFVSDWGWEGARSPISANITSKTDALRTLSSFSAPPSGNYQINRIRIYRTQSTQSDSAPFFFLREIGIGTSTTTDDGRTLGEVMVTDGWLPAPADLTDLTALWNGMLAGISGNSVRFCEAYTPYAWPFNYDVVAPDAKPVALGVFGQSLLVLTTGRPLLVSGSGPEAVDQVPLDIPQGCVSAQSAVSMGSGVAWASEDGLCWFGQGGARILTAGLMTRDDWRALKPSSIIGQMYEGLYLGSYDNGDGSGRHAFFLNPSQPSGLYFLDIGYEAMHFDELQDQLYVAKADGSIMRWDTGQPMAVTARSKVFRLKRPSQSFGWAEVTASTFPVEVTIDALDLDFRVVEKAVAKRPDLFTAPNATTLRYFKVVTSRDPFPLPTGFLCQHWQIEVSTVYDVQAVAMAHDVAELAQT